MLGTRLARTFVACYELSGRPEDLDRAIRWNELAADQLPRGTNVQLESVISLATDLARRHLLRHEAEDRKRATDMFRHNCRAALDRAPATCLTGAHNWHSFATQIGAWKEAAEAGQIALEAAHRLFIAQALRPHRETSLQQKQFLASETGYALAMSGDPDAAVLAVERGQALLLSEALEHEHLRAAKLSDGGHEDLVKRYVDAAACITRLEHAEMNSGDASELARLAEPLRRAREELAAAVQAVRNLPGHADFLTTGRPVDITAAATGMPLVYVLTHPSGGLALVVRSGEPTLALRLPALKGDAFEEEYLAFGTGAYDSSDHGRMMQAVDRVTAWLWSAVMGPLLGALPTCNTVRIVPIGPVGLLPLQAAWTPDSSAPDGRRYALDTVTITYAPNARAFLTSMRRVRARRAERILAVGDPQPVQSSPLPHAAAEADAVRRLFQHGRLLVHRQATKQELLRALRECDVLHMACHGKANILVPLASALSLADDEPLSLRDILALQLADLRLAVLSACETAVPGQVLAAEAIGFPAGLVQAGAAGVISSQWRVADASTRALMERFYHLWRNERLEPPEALRRAQLWLRHGSCAAQQQSSRDLHGFAEGCGSMIVAAEFDRSSGTG
jgi:hypothetical protein